MVRRTCLVTGGTGGIGAEIGRLLSRDGYRVIIADIDEAGPDLMGSLAGDDHLSIAMDVADEASVRMGFARAEGIAGPIAVLVHAAGVMLTQPDKSLLRFWESGLDRWDKTMAINARGTFLVASEFMRRRMTTSVDEGRIVLFSSLAAQIGSNRPYADYAASKAAVLGFMRAAAKECAPYGITVNAVTPGLVETPMMRRNIAEGTPVDDKVIIMGRFGQPSDIAGLVRYIVAPETSFVTGATFDINGGQRMA